MKNIPLKFGAKILTAVTLFVIVFSPLQPTLAQAQIAPQAGPTPRGATLDSTQVSNDIGCSLNPLKFDAAVCISGIVYVFTVGIGSGFAYVAAYFFDLSVQLSLSSTSYGLAFISQGWTTARDIANMAFLFILLYIAFMIMLQAETSGVTTLLATVIAVALLVNFSFFFTRVVIDAGNILSIQFYNAINAPPIASSSTFGAPAAIASTATQFLGQSANTKDLTADIMGAVNLQTLFSTDSFQKFVANSNFFVKLIALCFLYIGMGVMLWLLTVMFATVAVKFLFRIAVLWFLIIASPVALVSRAVPQFRKYYDQWQHLLISHAFYPAVFMFVFLILSGFARQVGGTNLAGAFTYAGQNTQDSNFIASLGVTMANIGIRMGLIIAVLYIGLEASKRVGVMGASMAHNFGGWVGGKFIGTVGGTLGGAGRYTLGWTGQKIYTNEKARQWAAEGGALRRTLWRGAGALGRQSFDVRTPLNAVGAPAGKASGAGGYTAAFDARVKRRTEEAEKFKPSENQLYQAINGVVKSLSKADQQRLMDAADKLAQTKEDHANGEATQTDVKTAKREYNETVQALGLKDKIKQAKEKAGSENAKTYATSTSVPSWKNLGMVFRSDREAAAKIRNVKNDADRIKSMLTLLGLKPTPAPPAAPAPAAGGAGGAAPMTRAAMDKAIKKSADTLATKFVQAAEKKFGNNLWKGAALHAQSTSSEIQKSQLFEMRQNRKLLKQLSKTLTHGPTGGTLREPGRGVQRNRPANLDKEEENTGNNISNPPEA